MGRVRGKGGTVTVRKRRREVERGVEGGVRGR